MATKTTFRHSDFVIKKVPPPTPDGREGRLFPPEHSWKTALLVIELTCRRNKILHDLCDAEQSLQRSCRFFALAAKRQEGMNRNLKLA